MLFYTSYSLTPQAIHKRCVALAINSLWLSVFVFEGSGFVIACTRNCVLLSVWCSVRWSFQYRLSVSFINLKLCLGLFWPPGVGISSICILLSSLLSKAEWKLRQKHVDSLSVVLLPMFLFWGSDLRHTVSKATTFDHLREEGGGGGPGEVMRCLWNTHEKNYTREDSVARSRYKCDAKERQRAKIQTPAEWVPFKTI